MTQRVLVICQNNPRHGERPDFVFDDQGNCDKCRTEASRLNTAGRPAASWNDVKAKRSKLLAASDWTQLGDVPGQTKQQWVEYRQALRDITSDFENPEDVVWPDPPS